REIFDILNRTDPTTLTDIQRAVRFYYLQRISFGSKTVGRVMPAHRTRPPSINLTTLEEGIMEVHWRMQRVVIERMDALECIRRHDAATTLFYIDPPYYGHENDYAVSWPREKFQVLNDRLMAIKGRFILSLNDRPEVRKIFADFRIKAVKTKYTASVDGNAKEAAEVIIYNF
ncbi:MAG: DNA adenine methylase, partial [Kiritimatiellales bacterium]